MISRGLDIYDISKNINLCFDQTKAIIANYVEDRIILYTHQQYRLVVWEQVWNRTYYQIFFMTERQSLKEVYVE